METLLAGERQRLVYSGWLSVIAAFLVIGELAAVALSISELLTSGYLDRTAPYLLTFVLLTLLRIAAESLSALLAANVAEAVKHSARCKLAEAEAAISPIDRKRPHAGEVANLIAGHVEALGPFLTRYRPARLRAVIVPVAILITTAFFSWVAAIILLITGPLIPVFMALIGAEARNASERQLQQIGSMNAGLLDRLQGLTTLRLFDAIPRVTEELLQQGEAIRARTMAVLRIAFLSSAVLELFSALGVAFAAVYVGFSLLGHLSFGAYGELTIFGGIFVLMIAPEYFRPLRDFAAAYHERAAAEAAAAEIDKLLTSRWLKLPPRGATAPFRNLALRNVSVILEGKLVLPEFSLNIASGERIALTGASGSGKSMLLSLLGGLITPTTGEIKIDGERDFSCSIAWLGQHPAFTQGSLAANLKMYRTIAGQSDIDTALKIAHAQEVVARFGRGQNEILRENASNVAGGEAQRLAVARLALSNADLILADEPTEHLDPDSARAVIDGLLKLSHGRTLIVATHDARIVSQIDRVIDMRALATAELGAAA